MWLPFPLSVGLVLALVLGGSLAGCVTTHTGYEVLDTSKSFSMSCAPRLSVRMAQFALVDCTVENKSQSWLTFRVKRITPRPDDPHLVVSTPEDIRDFSEAYAYKAAKDSYNNGLALGGLVVTGMVVMAASTGRSGLDTVGAGTIAGGATGLAAEDVAAARTRATIGRTYYAAGHILSGPGFRVPPGLFVRKALLLERRGNAVRPAALTVCLASPTAECLDLPLSFGSGHGSEAW